MKSVIQALQRIVVDRDFSISAAHALESEISATERDTQEFDELARTLASYRPGGGDLYFDEHVLECECRRVLERLSAAGGA